MLAWVMAAVGAPTAMVAMLVPIRESGSMLPQLALGGWAASVSGLLTLGVGIWFAVREQGRDNPLFYAGLLAGAGLLWVLAMLVFTALTEHAGETDGGANGWREAWSRLDLLRTEPAFRRFVLMRARPALAATGWLFPVFFFALGVAHSGVRAGRKTYLVDLAGGASAPTTCR